MMDGEHRGIKVEKQKGRGTSCDIHSQYVMNGTNLRWGSDREVSRNVEEEDRMDNR